MTSIRNIGSRVATALGAMLTGTSLLLLPTWSNVTLSASSRQPPPVQLSPIGACSPATRRHPSPGQLHQEVS
jgi:hypothetical protein